MQEHPGLYGFFFEDLKVGMQATASRTITETDLRNFSGVSGDTNPMHLNEEFAKQNPNYWAIRNAGILVHARAFFTKKQAVDWAEMNYKGDLSNCSFERLPPRQKVAVT